MRSNEVAGVGRSWQSTWILWSCVVWRGVMAIDNVACAQAAAAPEWASAGPAGSSVPVDVADACLEHLDRVERRRFAQQRLLSGLGYGGAAIGWGLGITQNRRGGGLGSPGAALLGTTALSLGLGIAALAIENPSAAAAVNSVGLSAEFAMGSAALTLATHETCNRDCSLVLSADTFSAVTSALVGLLIQAAYPPLYVSQHYPRYLQLPRTQERVRFALKLLQAQEDRTRTAQQISLLYAGVVAATYTFTATQVRERTDALILAASGSALLVSELVTFLIATWEPKPSERLLANRAPW